MKNKFLTGTVALFNLAIVSPSFADIELVEIVPTIEQKVEEEVITNIKDVIKAKQELTSDVQKAKDSINNVKNFVRSVKDPSKFLAETKKTLSAELMAGVKNLTNTKSQAANAETVKQTYTLPEDYTLDEKREYTSKLNQNLGKNMARLYARALSLRVELQDENFEVKEIKTIDEAQKATHNLQLDSLERWNKILLMQSYLDEYLNTISIQKRAEDSGLTAGSSEEKKDEKK